jgi:hypothetical protein
MIPLGFPGTISQDAQQAILLHHDGREELILRISYRISPTEEAESAEKPSADVARDAETDKAKPLPDRFAWVVTTPSEPDAYNLADADIFNAVGHWARPLLAPNFQSHGGCSIGCGAQVKSDAHAPSMLIFGEPAKVGPYDIQPVRALGVEALDALNEWLAANGFPTEDPGHMTYFVENGFTFLCIKVSPPEGADQVAGQGMLPPLHLSFATERPYYPLRFSSRQGVFDLNVYVLTSTPLDYEASSDSLARINYASGQLEKNVAVAADQFPPELAKAFEQHEFAEAPPVWHLNLLNCYDVNRDDSIAGWKEDIFLTADGDPPAGATAADPTLAALFVFALGGWLQWRVRKRPEA